ncbi:hypothetical protein B296_00003749, partial [Ensete ventricosum]
MLEACRFTGGGAPSVLQSRGRSRRNRSALIVPFKSRHVRSRDRLCSTRVIFVTGRDAKSGFYATRHVSVN